MSDMIAPGPAVDTAGPARPPNDNDDGPLLRVSHLSIAFDTESGLRPAVEDLSFDIQPGQVVALVGESGSGKSVSALAILGLLPPTATVTGSIRLSSTDRGSTEVIGASPASLRALRGTTVAAVFQEPFTAFNPVRRIGRQIAEAIRVHSSPNRRALRARVAELLTQVGLDDPHRVAHSFPHQLSGGQLQRAMIAMAISGQPDLLIADEPTTALDVTVQAGILALLLQLRDRLGMAVLLITHDMGVVAELADAVVVLRRGLVQEAGPVEQVLLQPTADYTRQLLAAVPDVASAPDDGLPVPPGPGSDDAVVGPPADAQPKERVDDRGSAPPLWPVAGAQAAAVHQVTITYGGGRKKITAVDAVSLEIPAGETLGLVGESGSGKTTLGLAIARLVPTAAGVIEIGGRDLIALSAGQLRAARADIGIVFQDPVASLNPRARVGAAIAMPLRVHRHLTTADRAKRVAALLRAVQLPEAYADRFPHELSGGERQRVAIARALALDPKLVIADEPTSALDVSVQATILKLLADLQEQLGFGCLFISHDLAVVRHISHHVAVLRQGHLVEYGPTDRIMSRPGDPYTAALLAAVPSADPRQRKIGRPPQTTSWPLVAGPVSASPAN